METTLKDVFEGSVSVDANQVEYAIYIPALPERSATIAKLQETLDAIHSLLKPYIDSYLWQKEPFHLSITDGDQDPGYPFLRGTTLFNDCINDEWFIVFLLRQITLHIPDAVATVVDNDGDVLLIEAALELPPWLDPSNSQHRVGLYHGQVHIIPLPRTPADLILIPPSPSIERALAIIRDPRIVTVADKAVQDAILDRLVDKPELHRARVTLPSRAAYVLLKRPQILQQAVEAFYLRDPMGLKACATMASFPPTQGNVSTVLTFTRTTYAQTVSQKFYAPKVFRLPPMSLKRDYKAAELGMKIACGLEMLYASTNASTGPGQSDNKPEFQQFVARLARLGYFRDERPGSKMYKELLEKAQKQFEKDWVHDTGSNPSLAAAALRATIDEVLFDYSDDRLQALLAAREKETEDDESWMHIDPKQLEEMLMQRMGRMQEQMAEESMEGVDLDRMMGQFEKFLEGSKSGVDGVEFPGLESDDEDEDVPISFDMERFMSILRGPIGGLPSHASAPEEEEQIRPKEPSAEKEKAQALEEMMQEMDLEINSHEKIGASFAREDEEDEDAPVDVSLNLVKNVLESFKSQQGQPGPVGNILGQLGIVLPADDD
ncbi:SGT1 protein-domain-containing protein [Dichotomocladium elegans]|nr:SGT1 protein-domain-containing protein [Dichotomocladium elegans]